MTPRTEGSTPIGFEILGPLRAMCGSVEADLGRLQARHVLARLVVARGRSVSSEELIDSLWPDEPPKTARKAIQGYVHHLRRAIGDVLRTDHVGYSIDGAAEVDAATFETLLDRARRMGPAEKEAVLGDALALWRGEALAEFRAEWAVAHAARLAELRSGAIEDRAEALLDLGRPVDAVACVVEHIERHPLRDRPRGLLMRALASQGRQTEALRIYHDYRSHLGEETGTEPSSELTELEARIASGWRGTDGAACVAAESSSMPSGVVTFMFTEVDATSHAAGTSVASGADSTNPLDRHDDIIRAAITAHGGHLFSSADHSFGAAFADPIDAVAAAVSTHSALGRELSVRVRIGIHTGVAVERAGGYYDVAVSVAARVMTMGHGGQTLLTSTAAENIAGTVPLTSAHITGAAEPILLLQLGGASFPPLGGDDSTHQRHNLGSELNSFVGRPEVDHIIELMNSHRLVTIVGPGGMGKSRCAMAVGRTIAAAADRSAAAPWSDGVWFVDLSSVAGDPAEAERVVIEALGLRQAGLSMAETVFPYLRDRSAVLVLDNCEHLNEWAREFSLELLSNTGHAAIIATSRVRLGVAGEQEMVLEPLSPESAAELFAARVADIGAGPFPAEDTQALCALLDHYPLAIELAAGRCRTLSAAEVLVRLANHPELLAERSGGRPERHRSLAAALDWSLSQLEPTALELLQNASIFGSSFDLAAAEAILSSADVPMIDVVDQLDSLIEQHLVGRDHRRGRFRMLEPIRQSLTGNITDVAGLESRHGHYYLEVLERVGEGLLTSDEGVWWDVVQAELANIRDAMAWAIRSGESSLVERSLRRLPTGVHHLMLIEATDWANDALTAFDVSPSDIPATALTAAMGWHRLANLDKSEVILSELDDAELTPSIRTLLCFVRSTKQFMAGDAASAREWAAKCVALAEADGDEVMAAVGRVAQLHPDAVEAADAVAIPTLRAYSRFYLFAGMDEASKRDSLPFIEDGHAAALASHNPLNIATARTVLAAVYFRRREFATGAALMREGADGFLRYGSHFLARHVVETVANSLAGGGQSYPAAVLWGYMDNVGAGGIARNLRNPVLPDLVAADLSAAQLAAAAAEGAALTIETAPAYALDVLAELERP